MSLHGWSLVALGVIIFLLGWLQHRWINEVSQAHETQARARLQEEVRLMTDAADTEIARAALFFTLPPVPPSVASELLERRWAGWSRDAPWPQVVTGVSIAESAGAGGHFHSVGDAAPIDPRSILPAETMVDFDSAAPPASGASQVAIRIPDGFSRGRPYLVQPIPMFPEPGRQPRLTWLVIHYNLRYLADSLFRRLVEKYSTAEDRLNFRFQLGPKNQVAPAASLSASQFHYRPDCVVPPGEGAGLSTVRVIGGAQRAMSGSGFVTSQFSLGASPPLKSVIQSIGQCRIPISPSSPGLMQLSVYRPPDRFNDAYTGFRLRNEVASALVLIVLVAALAALVISAERARKLASLQRLVAAGISHELRTPLASLSVAVDHLKNGHVTNADQARHYGELLEAQSRRLRNVVDQVLGLTRLGQSNGTPFPRAVYLTDIANRAIAALAPGIGEAGIQIQCDTEPDLSPLMADPDLMLRCVMNLVENSMKYAASGGWIRVATRKTSHMGRPLVELSVEDHGPGIPEDESSAVFEPFYRGCAARLLRHPGSGLGLAIVKSAVEAQGGWIKLEHVVPHGCRFRLIFPARDSPKSASLVEHEVGQHAVSSDTPD